MCHEIDKYKLFLGIKIKAGNENERTYIMSIAYFDHRKSMQRHCKLKPYHILRVVIHVHIHNPWRTKAGRLQFFFVNLCYTVRPCLQIQNTEPNENKIQTMYYLLSSF